MASWQTPGANWSAVNRILTNTRAGTSLITRQTFNDFKLHIEFRYPPKGNSGVYLRGRHEVQIEDSDALEPVQDHLGAVYGFLPPSEAAARKPGEWQAYDITLVGRMLTVGLNGKTLIGKPEIPGITGGAPDRDEGGPGPLMLPGGDGPGGVRNFGPTPAGERVRRWPRA